MKTRRELIRLLGVAASTGGIGQAAASPSDGINNHQNQIETHIDSDMNNMNRKAYVTLPAFCTKYLYANLHELMNRRPRPVIFMDTHDWERMRGQIVLERDRSMQMVGMITEALQRRGLIQTIDYRNFYSAPKQERKVIQCRNALESLTGHRQQTVAEDAAEGFINHFQRLGYQKSFRQALDNWEHALYRKRQAQSRVRRLKRGGGEPLNRAERITMQYTAALEVRRAVDRHFDFEVAGVIGQGEGGGVSTLLQESSFSLDDDVASLRSDGQIDQIRRFTPDETAYQRDVLDSITQVAQEATKTQHEDWFLLGSRMAVPHFPQLFMESWSQPAFDEDTSELVDETNEILSRLERRAEDGHPAHPNYSAEAIAEQHGIASDGTIKRISSELDRAIDLSNVSPELRDIADEDYESASILAAASTLMDPNYRTDEDDLYRRAWDIKRRYGSVDVSTHTVERYTNRGGYQEKERKQQPDWYQSTAPVRV